MEPIITLIVSAIALGAAAGTQKTVEKAIEDAYEGLKRLLIDHYKSHNDLIDAMWFLDKKPQDENRQLALAGELQTTNIANDSEVIDQAKKLYRVVEAYDQNLPQAIGMDIGKLKAAALEVENVQAGKSGTGVRIQEADISNGTAKFTNIGQDNPSPKG